MADVVSCKRLVDSLADSLPLRLMQLLPFVVSPNNERHLYLVFDDVRIAAGAFIQHGSSAIVAIIVNLLAMIGEINKHCIGVAKHIHDVLDNLVVIAGGIVVVNNLLATDIRQESVLIGNIVEGVFQIFLLVGILFAGAHVLTI